MKYLFTALFLTHVLYLIAQEPNAVFWHNGLSFTAAEREPLTSFRPAADLEDRSFRLLAFDHLLGQREVADLATSGIEILEYIPDRNYLCAIRAKHLRSDLPVSGLVSCFRLDPPFKMSHELLYGSHCSREGDRLRIAAQFYDREAMEICLKTLDDLRISYTTPGSDLVDMAYISLGESQLATLAALPGVKYIGCRPEMGEPEDREGRALHRVNMIGSNPAQGLQLDGSGVRVMVRDDGWVGPHIDFQGRLTNDTYNDIGTHGDGVSGVLTGAGNYDPVVTGMAPGSQLFVINYQPDFLDNTLDYHQQQGVVITNSSYSNGCNAGYTIEAQVVDKQLFENRSLLHVFSAGNSNNQDCGYGAGNQWGNVTGGHKIGKNAFTVANLRIDGTLETSSSRGPTRDRRMKPEISARGTNQLSTAPDNGILVFGGTSAAAPGIAGICALLYQAYKQFNQGVNPESALIKAAVMNTATDIGTPGPDYQFGCGVVDAYRAYRLLADRRFQKLVVRHGERIDLPFAIPPGTVLAKIMIYWPEHEASLLSSKALVNDLDMVVTSPSGTTHQPWVLNPSPNAQTLAAGASTGIDTLNNFEQVSLFNPAPGNYNLAIDGKFLPSNEVECFVLFEFEDESLRLTHPVGGEQFNITELAQVHLTAYGTDSISARLSSDAGRTWTPLGVVPAGSRLVNFLMPNGISSDSCLVEISQGNEVRTSGLFTITSGVLGFKVSKYCPGALELSWQAGSKDSFLIYQLGNRYMDSIGSVAGNSLELPNSNPNERKWFSVAGWQGRALSRREVAIFTPDTLVGCNLTADLGLDFGPENPSSYYNCTEVTATPTFLVVNRTANPVEGFRIHAFSDTGLVSEHYTHRLDAYDTVTVRFERGVLFRNRTSATLTAWLEHTGDENPFNDTLVQDLALVQLPDVQAYYPLTEPFSIAGIPSNWLISNPLDNSIWQSVRVRDKNSVMGNALMFENPNPVFRGQPIVLTSPIADLASAVQPYLYLDFAHHQLEDSQYPDSLRIVVREVCDRSHRQQLLLNGRTEEIKTVATTLTQQWTPTDTSWYWLAYDLSGFIGSRVVVEVQIFRGHNHRTLINNFEIREKLPQTSTAGLNITPNPGCYTKPVLFTPSSDAPDARIYLDAAAGGSPRFSSGAGPHSVRYTQQGKKRVNMHVKSAVGTDAILIRELELANPVSINYSFAIVSGRTVAFTNTSVNGEQYLWEFGDGSKSNEFSPVHTYDSAKVYRVKLTVTSGCGVYTRSVVVDLTITGTGEVESAYNIRLYPNPVRDWVHIAVSGRFERVTVIDVQGTELIVDANKRSEVIEVNLGKLPSGLYTICLHAGNGIKRYVRVSKI
jgi:hypothetical protein